MADLFQPSPFYLFVIFFKTILYIPLCASLGLVMSIFSEGKSRLASVMITILCLIIIFATNPILISMESLDLFIFIETLSKLAYGWFLPFCKNNFIQVFKPCFRNIASYSLYYSPLFSHFNIVNNVQLILSLLQRCAFGTRRYGQL